MIIEASEKAIDLLIEILQKRYSTSKIIIVCGTTHSKKIAENISLKIELETNVLVAVDTYQSIQFISNNLDDYSVILGVGGGKVMDISKELAFQNNIDLILFPTVISNDGLANGLVVLDSVNNGRSIYRKPADYIFIDYNIINAAPKKYLLSAIGDVFSNYSSINDFEYHRSNYSDKEFNEAKESVLKSLSIIDSVQDLEIDKIVDAIIESSKAVEVLKNSSAISGSEHLILHSLEKLYPNKNVNHGIAVASISLFTLFLQGKIEDRHIVFIQQNNIPLNFIQLFDASNECLNEIFQIAKNYRPSRKTILNRFDNIYLVEQFILFEKKIENMG